MPSTVTQDDSDTDVPESELKMRLYLKKKQRRSVTLDNLRRCTLQPDMEIPMPQQEEAPPPPK